MSETNISKWKKSPLINPYNNNEISVSVNPKSEYVKLYKEFIDELITLIRDGKPPDYKLTIKDCKKIKDSLPDEHAIIKVDGKEDILYDHLFIKYFIKKEKKYNYDEKYKEDIDIYLYLNVYNSLIKKLKPLPQPTLSETQKKSYSDSFGKVGFEYNGVKNLLKNNIYINKYDFSISKIIENLCKDIKKILYANKLKMTKNDYTIVLNNRKLLDYASSIYKLCEVKDLAKNENKMVDCFLRFFKDHSRLDPENEYHYIDRIFLQIIIILTKPPDHVSIYEVKSYIHENYVNIQPLLKELKRKSYEEIFIILQKIYENICYLYNASLDKEKKDGILSSLNTVEKTIIRYKI
jgi:hypothetical protein